MKKQILYLISEYRGQFIRAKIYCKSLEELRLGSAILICQALLNHDSVRNEPTEQENIVVSLRTDLSTQRTPVCIQET